MQLEASDFGKHELVSDAMWRVNLTSRSLDYMFVCTLMVQEPLPVKNYHYLFSFPEPAVLKSRKVK